MEQPMKAIRLILPAALLVLLGACQARSADKVLVPGEPAPLTTRPAK
jgi:hypothetical protein